VEPVDDNSGDREAEAAEVVERLSDAAKNERAREALKGVKGVEEVNEVRGKVVIRALDAASKLPEMFDLLEKMASM
jgi:hypothetical protein